MGISATLLLSWYAGRGVARANLQLKHFGAAEFGPYWPLMNRDQLLRLDRFRELLGYPVMISPAPGAIGRPTIGSDGQAEEGDAEKSWHNYLLHGEIYATDVMPLPPGGATATERRRWVAAARQAGFTGIGVYPDWKPRPGLHLDSRTDRTPDNPATWAGVRNAAGRQVYVGIEQGLA